MEGKNLDYILLGKKLARQWQFVKKKIQMLGNALKDSFSLKDFGVKKLRLLYDFSKSLFLVLVSFMIGLSVSSIKYPKTFLWTLVAILVLIVIPLLYIFLVLFFRTKD